MTNVYCSGGDDGTRTHDPLVANQVLYQLSYVPGGWSRPVQTGRRKLVGLGGFEPPTLRLSGVRSNQLSYRPPWAKSGDDWQADDKPSPKLRFRRQSGSDPADAQHVNTYLKMNRVASRRACESCDCQPFDFGPLLYAGDFHQAGFHQSS